MLTKKLGACLSPTVFRDGEFRFFFFSREESRIHVHVSRSDGEAKFLAQANHRTRTQHWSKLSKG
jgi:hypothetical protein